MTFCTRDGMMWVYMLSKGTWNELCKKGKKKNLNCVIDFTTGICLSNQFVWWLLVPYLSIAVGALFGL